MVAPMTIRVGNDDEIVDVPSITYGEVYGAIAHDPNVAVTISAPLPHTWCDAIVSAATSSSCIDSVLVITMSARYSASYDAARVGADMAMERLGDVRLSVLDSDALAGAHALVCLAAANTADTGADIDTVTAAAGDASGRVKTVAILGSLNQIHRVGRVPAVALWAARSVRLKPVVSVDASGFGIVARTLSKRSGMRKVVSAVVEDVAGGQDEICVTVTHVQCEQDALRVAGAVDEACPSARVTVCEMHPFAGVPAGAGTVAAAWLGEAKRT